MKVIWICYYKVSKISIWIYYYDGINTINRIIIINLIELLVFQFVYHLFIFLGLSNYQLLVINKIEYSYGD